MTTKSKIDPASELKAARDLAQGDGNAFHARVATYFRSKGWAVRLSPYYVDNATGQAREVDLLCEKSYPYSTHEFQRTHGAYRIRLFVECKYLTKPVLFWFDNGARKRALDWITRYTPFGDSHPTSRTRHRYIANGAAVAKLFRSGSNSDGGQHDPIYKGLAQSLGALIQRRDGKSISKLPSSYGKATEIKRTQYPVIVCGGAAGFYRADISDASCDVQKHPGNLLLEIDYAYMRDSRITEDFYLIDVVRFDALDAFLQLLDQEGEEARVALSV